MHARLIASKVWQNHGLSIPVDLRRLAEELGLRVETWPFEGGVNELIVHESIGVRPGLPRPWFRWCVAHAIGHHVMHVGTPFFLEQWQTSVRAKAERQAEEFAAFLVAGYEGWSRPAWELGVPTAKLALIRSIGGRGVIR